MNGNGKMGGLMLSFCESAGCLQANSCDKHLMNWDAHETIEISQWAEDRSHRWTVAYFVRGKEGYDLHFVGNRPFDPQIDPSDFMKLAKRAQDYLDKFFEGTA